MICSIMVLPPSVTKDLSVPMRELLPPAMMAKVKSLMLVNKLGWLFDCAALLPAVAARWRFNFPQLHRRHFEIRDFGTRIDFVERQEIGGCLDKMEGQENRSSR